jgi:hypothetical protein
MKSKPVSAMFVVWALCKPGPEWRQVSEPKPRSELVLVIRDQWKRGRRAHMRPAKVAQAA